MFKLRTPAAAAATSLPLPMSLEEQRQAHGFGAHAAAASAAARDLAGGRRSTPQTRARHAADTPPAGRRGMSESEVGLGRRGIFPGGGVEGRYRRRSGGALLDPAAAAADDDDDDDDDDDVLRGAPAEAVRAGVVAGGTLAAGEVGFRGLWVFDRDPCGEWGDAWRGSERGRQGRRQGRRRGRKC